MLTGAESGRRSVLLGAAAQTAFRYLAIATVPLVVAYSIYSLLYESHKSWYSYIINTLVGFVYTFGRFGAVEILRACSVA